MKKKSALAQQRKEMAALFGSDPDSPLREQVRSQAFKSVIARSIGADEKIQQEYSDLLAECGDGKMPGFREALQILVDGDIKEEKSPLFFNCPMEALDGRSPLDLLRAGEIDVVLKRAQFYIDTR